MPSKKSSEKPAKPIKASPPAKIELAPEPKPAATKPAEPKTTATIDGNEYILRGETVFKKTHDGEKTIKNINKIAEVKKLCSA